MNAQTAPALFLGHGSPMNALSDNDFTRAWRALGERISKPAAILCISAHWETKGTLITAAEAPRTIHDFYNFPQALYDITYPAPGSPTLAKRIEAMLAPHARADLDGWGLDHGAWSVLRFLYPDADVPVVQLSMDIRRSPAEHLAIGRALTALRDEGVMILGSGNIVHNLRVPFGPDAPTPDWAHRFDAGVTRAILAGERDTLADPGAIDPEWRLSMPEMEHYLPLLYVLGAAGTDDAVEVPVSQVKGGIAMTSFAFGLPPA